MSAPGTGRRRLIEAVLFDIDGTLLDHETASRGSVLSALELEAEALGVEAVEVEAALSEWRRLEELHYDTYLSGEIDLIEQRRRRAGGILEWLGAPERSGVELEEWFEAFLTGYRERWTLFEDVEPVLAQLEGEGRGLGVITNADAELQRRKLDALGILGRLPGFVASSTASAPKPEPAIFLEACELIGLPPSRVAYVGDRLDTDARGARDAGLLGIWLDREGAEAKLDHHPGVPVVNDLHALVSVIDFHGTGT